MEKLNGVYIKSDKKGNKLFGLYKKVDSDIPYEEVYNKDRGSLALDPDKHNKEADIKRNSIKE